MKEEEELQQVEEPFTFFCGCIPSVTMHILAKQERERYFNAGICCLAYMGMCKAYSVYAGRADSNESLPSAI